MSGPDIESEIGTLARLDLEGLRRAWRARFGPPPDTRSAELLRRVLAWRIQANARGGLDWRVRRQLTRRTAPRTEGLHLGAGARLRREWHGRTEDVIVEEDGFRWRGHAYPSLSAVARAMTGTRWNGPRFFGLRKGGE